MAKQTTRAKPASEPMPRSYREEVLLTARDLTCGDRNDAYNDPRVNMSAFEELMEWAEKWRKHTLDTSACGYGHDAAMVMVYAKIARIVVGAAKADNYIDAAAYLAMAWECHERVAEPFLSDQDAQ